MTFKSFFHEIGAYFSFFHPRNKKTRQLLFYSEERGYHIYYEGVLKKLLADESLAAAYITSDAGDPLLKNHPPNLHVFHFSFLLPFVLLFTDSKVVVMTTPDLNRFHIKKSVRGGYYVYLFHSIVSSHMIYREGAFDHYDSILCVGPHHEKEIRKTEELYGLKPKQLVRAGYYRLEKLYEEYREFQKQPRPAKKETALIAPSWGEDNILENCLPELVEKLTNLGYRIVIRPHRESVKRGNASFDKRHGRAEGEAPAALPMEGATLAPLIDRLGELYARENVVVDRGQDGDRFVLEADVLITDWSGAAFSYAFGTERPVLFIDVPRKIRNPHYEKLKLEPIEVALRPQLGLVVKPEALGTLDEALKALKKDFETWRQNIIDLRGQTVFNFGASDDISTRYIVSLLQAP